MMTDRTQTPETRVTINFETWQAHDSGKRRVGRPRLVWLNETQNDCWNEIRSTSRDLAETFRPQDPNHRQ